MVRYEEGASADDAFSSLFMLSRRLAAIDPETGNSLLLETAQSAMRQLLEVSFRFHPTQTCVHARMI